MENNSRKKIFAMVTTAKSKAYSHYALESFFRFTPMAPEDRFILIDNDRGSFSQEEASNYSSRVELLVNDRPRGFAANFNQIIELGAPLSADIYFLNNDLIFSASWLDPLLGDDPVILSPLSNREVQYSTEVFSCQVSMKLEDYLGKEEMFQLLCDTHRNVSHGLYNVIVAPFFCVKLPYLVYREVGLLDEDYGMGGGEDYDYCLRAILAGFKVCYALNSFILHFGGRSSWAGGETREEQGAREERFRGRFCEKWGRHLSDLILYERRDVVERFPGMPEKVLNGELLAVVQELWHAPQ